MVSGSRSGGKAPSVRSQDPVESTVIREHSGSPLKELADTILQVVDDYVGSAPQADDITILLLRRASG